MSFVKDGEKAIERKLIQLADKAGGIAYKWVSPNRRGVPDRILLLPKGKISFWELKSAGARPMPIQNVQIRRLKSLGFRVHVIDSMEGLLKAFQQETERGDI